MQQAVLPVETMAEEQSAAEAVVEAMAHVAVTEHTVLEDQPLGHKAEVEAAEASLEEMEVMAEPLEEREDMVMVPAVAVAESTTLETVPNTVAVVEAAA